MTFDDHANLAISAVVTPPSPADSGTSLVVTTGEGARFPTPPFNVTIWQTAALPTPDNAEIVRVTGIASDTLTITRAQEGSSARTILAGDLIAATVTAKTLTDVEDRFDTLLPWFVVEDYGAVGDGVTDDTDAIQAAIDAASAYGAAGQKGFTVRFSDGKTYNHTGLVVTTGAEQYVSVNLIGGSGKTTKLQYVGAVDGTAIWIQGLLNYHINNIWIHNGIDREATTGVLIDDITGTGTQSGQGSWLDVRISGFLNGIVMGGTTSTSELSFIQCEARDNTYGWVFETFNTLNIRMVSCSANGGDLGYYIHQAGSLQWIGGSVGENLTSDFFFDSNSAGAYLISGVRSENSNRFLFSSSGTDGAWIQCIACESAPSTNVDDILVDITNGGHLTFQGCHIRGKVVADDLNPSFFDFENTFVRGPQFVSARSGTSIDGVKVVARTSQFRDVSEVTTHLSPLLVQIGQTDGSLLTLLDVSLTGGVALLGDTPVDEIFSTPSLRLTTSPSAGYVLTSDADGDASWQAASGSSSGWDDRAEQWGLVSAWRLDDLHDSYGTNDLTNNNAVTFVSGHLGDAAHFVAASSQSLTVPDTAALSAGNNDFLWAGWVRLTDKVNTVDIAGKQSASTQWEWVVYYDQPADRFGVYVEGAGDFADVRATTFGSPTAGVWYFIAAYHDSVNDLVKISVNGGAWDSDTLVGGARDLATAFELGYAGTAYLNGDLDAVCWFKSPPDGIAAVADDIRDFLCNVGDGREWIGGWDIPEEAVAAGSTSFEDIAQWWAD